MLAIRLQRTGRSGHTQFRVIVQDSRFSPKRGRVVAYVGSYDPHAKTAQLDTEKIEQYLANGAQPSDRVAKLLQKEGVKLPDWVKLESPQSGSVRNPDKRRSTRPADAEPAAEPTAKEEPASENQTEEAPGESPEAETAESATTEEAAAETKAPAEEIEASETEPKADAEPAAAEAPAESEETKA